MLCNIDCKNHCFVTRCNQLRICIICVLPKVTAAINLTLKINHLAVVNTFVHNLLIHRCQF
jgi:hypothetical protein